MTKFISFSVSMLLLLATGFWYYQTGYLNRSFQRIEKDNSGQAVQMKFLKIHTVSPGYMHEILVRLTLTNDFTTPRGYLLPFMLGDTLSPSGIFYDTGSPDSLGESQPSLWVSYNKYPATRSNFHVSDLLFMGIHPTKEGFTAFFLPPQSTVIIENYMFRIREKALDQEFEVWEVEQLLVNGKTPIDDWISYDLLCSGNVHLMNEAFGEHLFIDRQIKQWNILDDHPERRLPKGEDAYVQATGIRKHSIKMNQYE